MRGWRRRLRRSRTQAPYCNRRVAALLAVARDHRGAHFGRRVAPDRRESACTSQSKKHGPRRHGRLHARALPAIPVWRRDPTRDATRQHRRTVGALARSKSFIAPRKLLVRTSGKAIQCDMKVGTVIVARMPRVAPPRTNSRNLECPYPPITMKSAEVSAAWDRIAFGTSK